MEFLGYSRKLNLPYQVKAPRTLPASKSKKRKPKTNQKTKKNKNQKPLKLKIEKK